MSKSLVFRCPMTERNETSERIGRGRRRRRTTWMSSCSQCVRVRLTRSDEAWNYLNEKICFGVSESNLKGRKLDTGWFRNELQKALIWKLLWFHWRVAKFHDRLERNQPWDLRLLKQWSFRHPKRSLPVLCRDWSASGRLRYYDIIVWLWYHVFKLDYDIILHIIPMIS